MLKNVQVLRAFAAMLVVFDHINGELQHSDRGAFTLFSPFRYIGNFGVDLFFVISGFIMVATSWNAFGQLSSSRTFILRRLARIYPPYWLVMIPIVITYLTAAKRLMRAHDGHSDVPASIFLLPQAHDPLLQVSWTLTFEMFFYIVFAVILIAKRKWLVPSLASWFVLELVVSALPSRWHNPYVDFVSAPLPIDFIIGASIGYLYRIGRMPAAMVMGLCGTLILVVVWVASTAPGLTADLTKNDLSRVLQFGVPGALIVYGAVGREMRFGTAAPQWAVELGNASYATYLWHMPIMIVLGAIASRLRVHGMLADALTQFVSIGIVIAVSLAAYKAFERPVTSALNLQIDRLFRPTRPERHGIAIEVGRSRTFGDHPSA